MRLEERNTLVLENLQLAHYWAGKFRAHRGFLELDDIRAIAYLGLVEAAERFDAKRGLAFSTFASRRIYGAVLDALRAQRGRGKTSKPTAFEELSDEHVSVVDEDREEEIDRGRERERFRSALGSLKRRDRFVMLYRVGDFTLEEIASRLGVSKSFVGQIEKRVVKNLSNLLGPNEHARSA